VNLTLKPYPFWSLEALENIHIGLDR